VLIKIKGLEDVLDDLNSLEKVGKKLIRRITQDIYEETLENVKPHTKTGRLENNIYHKVKGLKGEVGVENNGMLVDWRGRYVNYAIFVHFGSKPHKILPKNKKALRWTSGSVFQFAKSVNHPGYKGDEFLYNAARDTIKNIDKIFKEVVNASI